MVKGINQLYIPDTIFFFLGSSSVLDCKTQIPKQVDPQSFKDLGEGGLMDKNLGLMFYSINMLSKYSLLSYLTISKDNKNIKNKIILNLFQFSSFAQLLIIYQMLLSILEYKIYDKIFIHKYTCLLHRYEI